MCTSYYIEKIGLYCKKWFIDTSALMETSKIDMFVDKKDQIMSRGIEIIVLDAVIKELNKHLKSNNILKSRCAGHALDLIYDNPDLFDVWENIDIGCPLNRKHADCIILSYMELLRTESSQLVITEDKELSIDLINLSQSKSSKGFKVYACAISSDGELYMKKSVYETLNEGHEPIAEKTESENPQVIEKVKYIRVEPTVFERYGVPVLCAVGGAAGTYVTSQYGKQIFESIINAVRKL